MDLASIRLELAKALIQWRPEMPPDRVAAAVQTISEMVYSRSAQTESPKGSPIRTG